MELPLPLHTATNWSWFKRRIAFSSLFCWLWSTLLADDRDELTGRKPPRDDIEFSWPFPGSSCPVAEYQLTWHSSVFRRARFNSDRRSDIFRYTSFSSSSLLKIPSLLPSGVSCSVLVYPEIGRRGRSNFLTFLSGFWLGASGGLLSFLREISGVRHFIVLFTSFSLTRNCSVTFLPRKPSPPFLKSFRFSRSCFSFSVGTPLRFRGLPPKLLPWWWSGDSSVVPSVRWGSGVRVPSSLKRSGGSWKFKIICVRPIFARW